ncbi:MAG: aspartate kinase [Candidatus Obscuribacterales bacterium]
MSNSEKKIKVLKFGGTSVKNPQRLAHVAQIVASVSEAYKTIVVVSAMGDTTDSLVRLAGRCSDKPNPRELDVLLASGEQQSIALLSIVLSDLDIKAKSFTGTQLGIITESNYGNAEILSIDAGKIDEAFVSNDVIVVAGFQGVTAAGDITTLGRGGSDTSAVAIAAAVGAELCEIYTDVDGIFTADPNIIDGAVQHTRISYDYCLEMAAKGAQVIYPRAVECARENGVVLRVRSVFNPENSGTVIDCLSTSFTSSNSTSSASSSSSSSSSNFSRPPIVGITAVDGFSILKIEFDASLIHSQLIHDTVQSEVGHVNLIETFVQAKAALAKPLSESLLEAVTRSNASSAQSIASYVITGLNRLSGQRLVEELADIPGVASASIKFEITCICVVGSRAVSEVSSGSRLSVLLESWKAEGILEGLPPFANDLSVALYVSQECSRKAWYLLHDELLLGAMGFSPLLSG